MTVIGEHSILWSPRDDGAVLQAYAQDAVRAEQLLYGDDSLLFFYVGLQEALRYYRPPVLDFKAYLDMAAFDGERTGLNL